MSGKRLRPGKALKLDDAAAEEANRDHRERIDELQRLPFAGAKVFQNVELPAGVDVTIRHGLGRPPIWVGLSIPRIKSGTTVGDYLLLEWRDTPFTSTTPIDRSQFIVIASYNNLATIVVDVVVL